MTAREGTRTYVAEPADLPEGTLVQLLFGAVDRFGDAVAVEAKVDGEWRPLSYRALEERVRLVALGLEALGIARGDRVGILSENRPEWAIADWAALCFGAVDVPIYATLPSHQIAYILDDSEARLIFVSTEQQLAKIREAWSDLPRLERVVVFDDVAVDDERVVSLRTLLDLGRRQEEAGKGAGFRERALAARPDDVATVIYTSGTTGEPKGVMLTHDNIFSNTRAVEQVLPVGRGDVALSFLPLSHIFERMVDYFLLAHGIRVAYVPSFDLVAQSLTEVRPTLLVSTPRVYEKVYARVLSATGIRRRLARWARRVALDWADARLGGRRPGLRLRIAHAFADFLVFRKIRARMGGRIRFCISGGAPLDGTIARFFYGAGILVLEGYGLTETSPVTNVNTPQALKFGTVGKPVPGTEVMVAADGEILVRGPQVMKGYFHHPEATAEVLGEDGWFHTGDIGEIDAEGFLRITDRKKDLIVTAGGKNIAPQPIENCVRRSRFVAEAVVLGDRRPYPVLLVVPDFDELARWARAAGITETDRNALIADARVREAVERDVLGRLDAFAGFERPKKMALLEREFSIERGELTPTLKVRRRVVEEHYRAVIDSLYGGKEQVVAE
ncbi:MAG TPA: long-chain fatty acid--CoA ligase [Longimicrobiales bacterium]